MTVAHFQHMLQENVLRLVNNVLIVTRSDILLVQKDVRRRMKGRNKGNRRNARRMKKSGRKRRNARVKATSPEVYKIRNLIIPLKMTPTLILHEEYWKKLIWSGQFLILMQR